MNPPQIRCSYLHTIKEWPYTRRCWETNATWVKQIQEYHCPSHKTAVLAQIDQDKARHPSSQTRTLEELEPLVEALGGSIFEHDEGHITITWSPNAARNLMLPRSYTYISISMIPKTTIRTIIEAAGDLETCSWCSNEVPDKVLIDTDNGRICPDCNRTNTPRTIIDTTGFFGGL